MWNNSGETYEPAGASEVTVTAILFCAFLALVGYLSLSTGSYQPTAEERHLAAAQLRHRTPGVTMPDSLESYHIGPAQTTPYLYDLAMGKLLNLRGGMESKSFLRIANIVLAGFFFMASVLFVFQASPHEYVRAFFLLAIAVNAWTVLSFSSINNQNLCMLICAILFLCLARFLRGRSAGDLLAAAACAFLGSLAEPFFLSVLFCGLAVLVFFARASRGGVFFNPSIKTILAAVVFLLALSASLYLYGNNLVNHRALIPGADKVLGAEVAYRYYPEFRAQQDLLKTRREKGELQPEQFPAEYATVLGNAVLNSHAENAVPIGPIEYLGYAVALIPGLVGTILLLQARLRRRSFNATQYAPNPVVAPLFVFMILYLLINAGQDFAAYRTARVMTADLAPERFFPVFFCGLFLIAHFSFAYLRRISVKVLFAVLLFSVFAVPNLQRIVLHWKSGHSVAENAGQDGKPAYP